MADAVSRARRATVLALVGGLLVANPLYLGFFVEEPRPRSPTGYTANVIDPTITPEAPLVIDRLGEDEVLDLSRLQDDSTLEPTGTTYEEGAAAASAIRAAVENGTTTTDQDAVAVTLNRLDAHFEFVATDSGGTPTYHRFEVEKSDERTIVTAGNASKTAVARYIVSDDMRRYSALSPSQQAAVDKVLEAGDYGYRPYQDAGFDSIRDNVIVKDGTYYVFAERIHADDFIFSGRFLVGGILSVLGVVLMLIAVVVTLRQ